NTIPIAGAYDYQIYAVTTAGHGYSAILNDVVIGSTCTITVLMYDETGGGWNRGAITFVDDDEIVRGRAALVTGSEGTVDVVLPLGMNIHCVWNPGLFDEFCSFILTNYAGKEIYVSEGTPQAGTFFSFTNNCNQNVPAECTDFSAVADPDGELFVNLSWTNPTTTFLGDPLTDLTSVVITRDNEVIQTITNPVIGGEETFVDDDIINPDIYTYCVYGINSDGEGAVLCETIEVGKFFYMPTEGSMVINTCSGVLYDDGGPYQNYSNSLTSMTIIFPENNNQQIEITGTYELEEGFDFLYVFEGAGIEGSLISSYTGVGGLYNKSTNGALTLLFASDASTSTSGFMAEIHCVENIGIEEETASFKVYPNPANDFISIEGEETFDQISIYNTLGQLITTTDNKVISTSEMTSGVYILKITTATGNTISKKIIVKH
ncbi:MAG: T9SS type A sorting domain-containing protein, partial [Bacteroidales bacterium]|nr:T9SS type A sorting domain-containing protein [Bacteroidales bacterium]